MRILLAVLFPLLAPVWAVAQPANSKLLGVDYIAREKILSLIERYERVEPYDGLVRVYTAYRLGMECRDRGVMKASQFTVIAARTKAKEAILIPRIQEAWRKNRAAEDVVRNVELIKTRTYVRAGQLAYALLPNYEPALLDACLHVYSVGSSNYFVNDADTAG